MTNTEMELMILRGEFKALKEIAAFMSDKIQRITSPKFKVGDTVRHSTFRGGSQLGLELVDLPGSTEIGVVKEVDYHYGSWVYHINNTGNVMEHLVRAVTPAE